MRNSIFPKREPGSNSWLLSFSWEQRNAKELCNIGTGKSNTQDQIEDGIYPFFIRSDVPVKSNKFLYDCEAVITIGDGNIGKVFHYVNGKFDLHQRCYKMTDFQFVTGKYFFYFFSTHFYERAMKMTAKATVDSVRLEMIADMEIRYPHHTTEQVAIANFFSNLDRLITLHQCNYFFNATEMVSRNVEKTFSWEQREFEKSFSLLQNNTLSRSDLSDSPGVAVNIHYGDVLIKFGEYLDMMEETFPWIKKQSDADKFRMSFLQDGDIVFADTAEDETAGKCCEIRNCSHTAIISGLHTIPCRPESKFAPGYLGYYLNSTAFHEQLIPLMQGTKVVSISKTALKSTTIQYPSDYKEQQKIGMFFRGLDCLITLHQREYFFTRTRKNLKPTSKKTNAWEQRKFSEITFPAGEKNKDNLPLESYSITNEAGFVPQDEKFENGGTMREADKRMYYIVTPNSFAYNPARINVGSIGYQNTLKNVIVSSLYEVFKTTDDVNDRLLWHWFKSPDFRKLIEQLQEGGVRLYFYYDKLCMGKVYLPEIDEQGKIGSFFDTLDRLITLHQRERLFLILEEILC